MSPDGTQIEALQAGLEAQSDDDARISREFRDSLKHAMRQRARKSPSAQAQRAQFDIELDRHEAKYLIPESFVPEIREFIRPFCERDPHGVGDIPQYVITTLQFDSPWLSLHCAKQNEALNRFKLRARTYGEPGDSAVYLEIKRKVRGTIIKSRASVPFHKWGAHVVQDVYTDLTFKSRSEETGFLEFRRLAREIGARPIMLIRYCRESYFGILDHYARVTFDRRLQYQPTEAWDSWGRGGRWIPMDTPLLQGKGVDFSGVILEIKTLSEAPQWMMDLVIQFDLERVGNCKYASAISQEGVIRGWCTPPPYLAEMFGV